VLADPEGNEFCIIEPGNNFLADCRFIGALAYDGSQEVRYFWSETLGWPLVWDQDQETAIRSPRGGPKITWGGPPLMPKTGKNRLHFDLAPPIHGDRQAEVDRLLSLGARGHVRPRSTRCGRQDRNSVRSRTTRLAIPVGVPARHPATEHPPHTVDLVYPAAPGVPGRRHLTS